MSLINYFLIGLTNSFSGLKNKENTLSPEQSKLPVQKCQLRVRFVSLNLLKPSSYFFCCPFPGGSFLLFIFHVYLWNAVLSVPCSLVITFWERADLLDHLRVVFFSVFVTFPYGVLGQV